MNTHVVVLAGGAGTRFWPAGRRERPKQLLPVASKKTLLRETLDRCAPLAPPERTWIVTNESQVEPTRSEAGGARVVAEPDMRNTAAAIALAALLIERVDKDGVMIVLPADHVIRPPELFVKTFQAAAKRARDTDALLTVGIEPTGPATGYGYIESGETVAEVDGLPVRAVTSFKEKPDASTAMGFLERGGYYWNAGTFVWRAGVFRDAVRKYLPGHEQVLQAIEKELDDDGELQRETYARFEKVPVDIGILERANNVEVVPASFEWDDVGSWLALDRLLERDSDGNVIRGDHVGVQTRNCIVIGRDGHITATLDVDDLIVVCTKDATLVAPKSRAEDVKKLVEKLQEQGRDAFL
ncbi:MAG: mannose-1-phosphate guanylyltransferase [Planctomycetota bacterium]